MGLVGSWTGTWKGLPGAARHEAGRHPGDWRPGDGSRLAARGRQDARDGEVAPAEKTEETHLMNWYKQAKENAPLGASDYVSLLGEFVKSLPPNAREWQEKPQQHQRRWQRQYEDYNTFEQRLNKKEIQSLLGKAGNVLNANEMQILDLWIKNNSLESIGQKLKLDNVQAIFEQAISKLYQAPRP
jgi:hypothetical protein